jgi:hypothetical protein
MKELNAITKFTLPEGYPLEGFYLVNRRMENGGWRTRELIVMTKFVHSLEVTLPDVFFKDSG